jgi:hypothetical protein
MLSSCIMSITRTLAVQLMAITMALVPCAARAEVTRVEITSRVDVLGGKPFGPAGPYEKIIGKVFFAVDPADPHNRSIVDMEKAPRDARGRVEFSADLYVLAPKEPARGNGAALFDVLNRGRKNVLRDFNRAAQVADPTTEADYGDGFLIQHGFTLVWVGWQFSVPHRDGLMGLDAPVATDHGRALTGRVTTSFTLNTSSPTYALDDFGRYGGDITRYPPVDAASAESRLTVRDGFLGQSRTIARDTWQFGRMVDGHMTSDATALSLKGGFEPGRIYELSYEARDPVVAGVAFAALRDLVAAFKHQPNALVPIRYAYAFGASQDGRLLREFLYEGFNVDEQGRRVFDGVMAHVAGAARSDDFNARFARPNGLAFFTATLFPFLDLAQRDPVTGKTDGLLTHLRPEVLPKIFYTNSSTEYWGGGRAAALTHTTLDGRSDAEIPANVRIYLFAGTQHIPGGFLASQGEGQQQANLYEYSWGLRALLIAMDRWVREDVQPPASRYPRLTDATLISQQSFRFPSLPGIHSPLTIPGGYRADLDRTATRHQLPFLVPQVDADGNERGGIRLPDVAVPVATYTGWNFRSPMIGAPDELLPLTGSYIPLAATRAAREQNHDPRLSIEERYPDRATYLGLVKEAALKLIQEEYLLSADLAGIVGRAAERWDEATRGTAMSGK